MMKYRRAFEVERATHINTSIERILTAIFILAAIGIGGWLWLRAPSTDTANQIPFVPANTIVPRSHVWNDVPPLPRPEIASTANLGPSRSATSFPTQPSSVGGAFAGQPAPDFALSTLGGGSVSLSDFRGKGVILNFWASWCPPCRDEMPLLVRSYERYQDNGLVILAINVTDQDTRADATAFIEQFGVPFQVLFDEEGHVTDHLYFVYGLPVSVFIDRDGVISRVVIGGLFSDEIDGLIAEILK
jgi:thiol-disulfide isomerase/thioredoxin